ncbi:MAG: hypothetical protein ACLUD2_20975 [Clostridium sp.]
MMPGQLFVSVLTGSDHRRRHRQLLPCWGDIILAEPGASSALPAPGSSSRPSARSCQEGFQRAEFLLDHGFVDKIVERKELKQTLETILRLHQEERNSWRRQR